LDTLYYLLFLSNNFVTVLTTHTTHPQPHPNMPNILHPPQDNNNK
jgi:hypothetical protein